MVISGRYDQLFLARYAEENRLKGKRKAQLEVATNMLKSGESIEKIITCCGLNEDEVRSLEEGMLGRV